MKNLREKLARFGDNLRLGAIGLGLILFVVFLLQNTAQINVNFLFFETMVSTVVVILVASVLGFVVGLLVEAVWRHRRHRRQEQKRAGAGENAR